MFGSQGHMRLRGRALFLHVARTIGCVIAIALVPSHPLVVAIAIALFFELFAFHHDVMHGALGLPRQMNEALVTLLGLATVTSGHSTRRLHLRHHAHPLADDDVEGEGARQTWWMALLTSPLGHVRAFSAGFRGAPARDRAYQVGERLLVLLTLAVAIAGVLPERVRVYVFVAWTMQITTGLWASHIPHNAPRWLKREAARLAFLRSPALLSLAFHDVHHRLPKVPCDELVALRA